MSDVTDQVPVLKGRAGDLLTITVDVENTSVPYTVVWDGSRTVIHSLVDREEQIELTRGVHRLAWAFIHIVKGWSHSVATQITGRQPVVLDDRSEANKDNPYAIGLALVEVD